MPIVLSPPGERMPLTARLAALGKFRKTVAAAAGLFALIGTLAAALLAACSLDAWLHLSPLVRGFALTGTLVLAGIIWFRRIRPAFRWRTDPLSVALDLEYRFPRLNDSLGSAISFLSDETAADRGISHRLCLRRRPPRRANGGAARLRHPGSQRPLLAGLLVLCRDALGGRRARLLEPGAIDHRLAAVRRLVRPASLANQDADRNPRTAAVAGATSARRRLRTEVRRPRRHPGEGHRSIPRQRRRGIRGSVGRRAARGERRRPGSRGALRSSAAVAELPLPHSRQRRRYRLAIRGSAAAAAVGSARWPTVAAIARRAAGLYQLAAAGTSRRCVGRFGAARHAARLPGRRRSPLNIRGARLRKNSGRPFSRLARSHRVAACRDSARALR